MLGITEFQGHTLTFEQNYACGLLAFGPTLSGPFPRFLNQLNIHI